MDQNNQPSSNKRITWNEQDFPVPEKPEMGIEFYNINSGETRKCDSEALITAFFNSSNLHPNAMVGQDMGWRLAKDTIRRMRDIQDDEDRMEKIVRRFRLNDETEITDSHILTYMFQEDVKRKQKKEAQKKNAYAQKYEDDLRSLDTEDRTDDFDDDDEDDDDSGQPHRTTGTAAPTRRLSPEEEKLLSDAKKREANIAAGRPINDGIEGADEALSQAVANEDDALEDEDESSSDEGTSDDQGEGEGEGEGEQEQTPPPAPLKPATQPRGGNRRGNSRNSNKNNVAKPNQNSDNNTQS